MVIFLPSKASETDERLPEDKTAVFFSFSPIGVKSMRKTFDRLYAISCALLSFLALFILAFLVYFIVKESLPALQEIGIRNLLGTAGDQLSIRIRRVMDLLTCSCQLSTYPLWLSSSPW